jgi:hypothetical protein
MEGRGALKRTRGRMRREWTSHNRSRPPRQPSGAGMCPHSSGAAWRNAMQSRGEKVHAPRSASTPSSPAHRSGGSHHMPDLASRHGPLPPPSGGAAGGGGKPPRTGHGAGRAGCEGGTEAAGWQPEQCSAGEVLMEAAVLIQLLA